MSFPNDFRSTFHQTLWFPFQNTESEAAPAFGVMEITGASYDPTGHPYATTKKPTTSFQRFYAVNGPTEVAANGYGRCSVLGGPVMALCDSSGTPAYGETWGVKHGEWELFENRPGFDVLGGVLGSGSTQRSLVLPYAVNQLIGTLDGALSQGSTATFNLFTGAAGSEADSTMNLTTADWLIKSGDPNIDSGNHVSLTYVNGVWYVEGAECN